jgi:hypothetical protein
MTWPAPIRNDLALAARRTDALVAVIDDVLPSGLPTTGEHDDWPLLGWGLLAACAATARDIQTLAAAEAAGSATTLTRRLYELTVTLAWIAADPGNRRARWLRWDRQERVKTDNDLVDRGQLPILEPATRADFDVLIASGDPMPSIVQRAEEADAHWVPLIEWMTEPQESDLSFRAMYRRLYRWFSSAAHGGVVAIEPHVSVVGDRGGAHAAENPPSEHNAMTMAPLLLAIALLTGGETLGIVDIDATLDDIFSAA